MQVDAGAPLEVMLAPDEINEALNALRRRTVSLIEIDMDNEAEGVEPDIEAEPLLEEADRISVASSAPEFHECLPATDEDAARLGFVSAFAPEPENGPVGRGLQDDAEMHPRVRQLMLDRLAQPQFWNAALTIATRQHAQLLHMHDTLEELETGTESLATGEQVAQWFGRSGPGDWPLHRLKVHIPAAAMAYLCDAEADASASGGGVALRGMRFVMAGGLKAGYTPPIFQDVEPHRHLLLQQLRNRQALPFDCQDYCGLVGALEPSVIRTDMWIPFPAAGQSFADFARKAHVSSHRWRSAVLATPPVLDVDTAEMILPSVDAFQVQASGMTLQELRSKGAKTSKNVDDFLAAPSLSAFLRSPTQYAARCTSTNGTHGFGRHAILPCLTRTVHFLVLHETGASKSIGHCPTSWFSLSQSCHRHCTLAKLPGKLFGTSTLGPLCGATVRWDMRNVCTLNPNTLLRISAAYCSLCMTGEFPLVHFLCGLRWEFPSVLGTAQSRGSPDHLGAGGTACCW